MALHKDLVTSDIHTLIRWTHADSAARLAESVAAADVGKLSHQTDDDSYYLLSDTTPTWTQIDGSGGGGGLNTQGLGEWKFDTSTTDSDPGNGKWRLNNADETLATFIYIDDLNDAGLDASVLLENLVTSGSYAYIQRTEDSTEALLYELTGDSTDGTGYWKLPVTFVSEDGGGWVGVNNKKYAFMLIGASGGGGSGDVVGPAGGTADGDLVIYDDTTGKLVRAPAGGVTEAAVQANTAKVTNATHTGDVTGSVALTIADEAVTLAKMAHIATDSFLGRDTAGTGDVEVLDAATSRTILNVEDGATAGDADAIHDNVAAEISAVAAKTALVRDDFLLIEDSGAADAKKSVTLGDIYDSAINAYAWDGALKEIINVDVTSNGTVITLAIEANGGGDLTAIYDNVEIFWDTTPADTVTLTAGTDASPELNYVYATESGGTITLTNSTVGFPAEPFTPVATVLCQSAASLQTDGAMKVHVWTDHIGGAGLNGHISHINKRLRTINACWVSGVAPGDMTTSSPDAYLSAGSGSVMQLHEHAFPALDMSTGANTYIVNDPTTPYKNIGTLDDVTQDAAGGTINNKHFKLVLWGAVNEDTADCKFFLNLPTGTYNNASDADTDTQGFTVYTIPQDYTGVGFLIAEYNLQGADSGLWVQNGKGDLRGLLPSTSPGGGGGGVGDVSGGTVSVVGEVPTYTDTTGKVIGRSDILFGSATPTVGTRTLTNNAAVAGGAIVTNGIIQATNAGAVALGQVSRGSGTGATLTASGIGSVALGNAVTLIGGAAAATIEATQAGAFAQGYILEFGGACVIRASGTGAFAQGSNAGAGTIQATTAGSFAAGNNSGSTIECVAGALGGFAHGHATSGGIIRCTGGSGTFTVGSAVGAGTSIISSGIGAFSTGTAISSGDIAASGDGAFAGGRASTNAITASGDGSFAWGDSTGAAIVASATNAVQLGEGTNNVADSLQVGDTTNGLRLLAQGTTSTTVGSFWTDGTDVFCRTGGVTKNLTNI